MRPIQNSKILKILKSIPPTLHTLNAVRVLAEYCIVSIHIYFGHPESIPENYDIGLLFLSHGVAIDFMSLFFVLSGFVCMYTTNQDEAFFPDFEKHKQFLLRRFKKTYPCYVFSLLLGLPHFIIYYITNHNSCMLDIVGLFCQLFCMQCWLGHGFAGSNSPSWYIGTLAWLWILFPFLRLNKIVSPRPWTCVFIFYVLSICINMAFANYDTATTRQLPIIRIFEFLMGCAAACTLDEQHSIGGTFVCLCVVIYCIYTCLSTSFAYEWGVQHDPFVCGMWPKVSDDFVIKPGTFVTLTSIVWALLFHWLAIQELNSSDNTIIKVLGFDFFKSLASYSLQLYLFHLPINDIIQGFFKICGAHMWISKDIIMVLCYSLSYFMHVCVQPRLDRLME